MAKNSMAKAMNAIKDEKCCECSKKAKGLVYRRRSFYYYCKECLHNQTEKKDSQEEKAAAS